MDKPRAKQPLKKYRTEANRDIFEFNGESDEDLESTAEKSNDPEGSWSRSSGDTLALDPAILSRPRVTSSADANSGTRLRMPPSSKALSVEQTQNPEPGSGTSPGITKSEPTPTRSGNAQEVIPGTHMGSPLLSSARSRAGHVQKSEDFDSFTRVKAVELSSSASMISPNKTITVTRKRQNTENLIQPEEIEGCEPERVLPADHTTPKTINPAVLLANSSEYLEERDELSLPLHGPETWSINQTTLSKTTNRDKQSESGRADEPGSDDIAIGLPKDQYQPRPSRSRSGKDTADVIVPDDFSKKPETIAKKKRKLFKKSKNTAFGELIPADHDDKVDRISPGQDEKIFAETVDLPETTNSPIHPLSEDEDPGNPMEDPMTKSKPLEKPEMKKQRGRPKKVVSTKTADIDTPSTFEAEPVYLDADIAKPKATASTGKTKKETKAKSDPVSKSEELVHDSDDELGNVNDKIREHTQVHDEISGNYTSQKRPEMTVASQSPSKSSIRSPKTPQKAEMLARKAPDKHSPISSGKVKYRVGLSKRARIAPLLRIVRKT